MTLFLGCLNLMCAVYNAVSAIRQENTGPALILYFIATFSLTIGLSMLKDWAKA